MIFISAGHNIFKSARTGKIDPGAVAGGTSEAQEMVILRDLVCRELDILGAAYIKDKDNESLSEYLERIKTGNASVVLELHMNAGGGTGTETLIEEEADRLDFAFAKELTDSTAKLLQIKNRGVKKESESARKRLGLMREEGIIGLVEVCFIDNPQDMDRFKVNKVQLAKAYAQILVKYEKLIQ